MVTEMRFVTLLKKNAETINRSYLPQTLQIRVIRHSSHIEEEIQVDPCMHPCEHLS